jgi:hypothetical protein
MGKRNAKKQSAKATLAEVVKEMAKPRVAMSAREHSPLGRNEVLVRDPALGKITSARACALRLGGRDSNSARESILRPATFASLHHHSNGGDVKP